ncbi:MAG: hypothetical protein LBB09_01660 [Rickettsiales bacterium]|jgi:hypothetical protein|nr:hypothetical protein [Rickettsiales bacterium]
MRKIISFVLAFYLLAGKAAPGGEPLAIFGDWYFFKYVNSESKLICYIMSAPKSRYDNFNKRGQSFFTIIQENGLDYQEIYLSFGINYNKNITSAELEIAKHKFPILAFEDKAWAYNKTDDGEIMSKIGGAVFFSVVVSFENGKNLMDVYSSIGFAEALEYLKKNCR